MALRVIKDYIARDANNIALVYDLGNIVSIKGNIFLYYDREWLTAAIFFCLQTVRTECAHA